MLLKLAFPILAILLLAAGARAQTARGATPPASEGAFYAESAGALSAGIFGTVRLRADSVEVLVSEGTIGRYRVQVGEEERDYRTVSVRAHLGPGATGQLDQGVESAPVVLLPSISAGAEHPIGPLRLALPRPRGSLEGLGLVLELTAVDPTHAAVSPEFSVFACSRYGAFALPRTRAATFRTCGVPERTEGAGGAAEVRIPPVRPVCVEDPAAPNGLRPADLVAERLQGDTVVTRAGERRPFSELRPRVVGYAAGPRGLEPAQVDARSGPRSDMITLLGHTYGRWGPPTRTSPGELVRIGEAHGASVFIPRGSGVLRQPDALYVLLADCTFQAYVSPENMR